MKTDSQSTPPQPIRLSDYTPPTYAIDSVHLSFNLHEQKTRVKAKLQMTKKLKSALVLNGEQMQLISVAIDGSPLNTNDYDVTADHLKIFNTPEKFLLETEVEINPEANKSCEGLYVSQNIFCTQCEAESFRRITYFLDRPDVMTTYSVEIEADEKKYPVLLSNGDCLEKKSLGNGRHKAVWKDPFKKPSYLFALVAGDLGVISDTYKTTSGKNVKLEVYASHGKQDRCHHALESLKRAMKWDEDTFGLEYDLNQYMIVSIDDFNMGAMENKGLNIFNSRLVLADKNSATDHDFHSIESVVGHEYFHNWSGNRVTCRNWFELSLKEGLTVFRDQEFSADLHSRAVQRIYDVDSLRTRQFSEDAGPNAHAVRPESCLAVDNFYTATIYEKGAEVIRMMKIIVGEEGFKKAVSEYFKRFDGQAVTILDFAQTIAEVNNVDFTQFKLWYSQAGTPVVSVKEYYDAQNKKYNLTLSQHCELTVTEKQNNKTKLPFHIPLKMGLIDSHGKELSPHNQVLHLKEQTQTWTFDQIESKPTLSLNRDFSAAVKLNWEMSNASLIHLIKYDTDAFNRRESCNKMLLQETQRLISLLSAGRSAEANTEIIDALGAVLSDQQIDPEFKALILSFPSNQILAQEETVLRPDLFKKAKDILRSALVEKFKTDLIHLYKHHHQFDHPGHRSMKACALGFLVYSHQPEALDLSYDLYRHANNMTDKLTALGFLIDSENAYTNIALNDFYNTWSKDSVVLNKWFSTIAASSHEKTFERVIEASQRSAFDQNNPNNIYSLYAAFAGNMLRFFTSDEKIYSWYADELLRIDKLNPQVAARMANGFNFVSKLPADIKNLVQKQIDRMLASNELSRNARELLEKTKIRQS